MNYDPRYHHRRTIRLQSHDFSQPDIYFITLRVQNQKFFLSEIDGSHVILNNTGRMIECRWQEIRQKYPHVIPGHYVITPDHFHGVIIFTHHFGIEGGRGEATLPPPVQPTSPDPFTFSPTQKPRSTPPGNQTTHIGQYCHLV